MKSLVVYVGGYFCCDLCEYVVGWKIGVGNGGLVEVVE